MVRPKNSISCTAVNTDFLQFWQILDVAEGRLLRLGSRVSVLKNDQWIACRLSKLKFWCLSCVGFSFALSAILWIFVELLPNQSKGKGTCTSFLTNGREQITLNFFPRELKNMLLKVWIAHVISFLQHISDFANLPFWSVNMGYRHSVAANLSLVFGPHPSFLHGISCLQTPLFMVELFWWLPSSTFLLTLFDKNNLFIKWWTSLDFLWICFARFKSMLKKVLLWSSYFYHISVADSLSVCYRYDVAVIGGSYQYGIFSIRFLWEKTFAPHIISVRVRG